MNIADRFTLRILREGPTTTDQLAIECGVKLDTMRGVMSRLHKAGEVHVREWFRVPSGQLKGIWVVGPGEDAPKPKHVEKAPVVKETAPRVRAPRKRHPTVAQIQAITAGVHNPFATAMWNVAQGAR